MADFATTCAWSPRGRWHGDRSHRWWLENAAERRKVNVRRRWAAGRRKVAVHAVCHRVVVGKQDGASMLVISSQMAQEV